MASHIVYMEILLDLNDENKSINAIPLKKFLIKDDYDTKLQNFCM